MTRGESGLSRASGEKERDRRQDGGGERDPLPQSEENRGNRTDDALGIETPAETEPTRSALRNQSQVKPEDYERTSQSGGSDDSADKV